MDTELKITDFEEILYSILLDLPYEEKTKFLICETEYMPLLNFDSPFLFYQSDDCDVHKKKIAAVNATSTQTVDPGPRQKCTQKSLPRYEDCGNFVSDAILYDEKNERFVTSNNNEDLEIMNSDNPIVGRLLASNVQLLIPYKIGHLPKTLENAPDVKYSLQILEELWDARAGSAMVVDIDWNPYKRHIFATALALDSGSAVAVYSLKNPLRSERFYKLPSQVSCVSFSKNSPNLLAIGLDHGELWVIDISSANLKVMYKRTSHNYEAVHAAQWWSLKDTDAVVLTCGNQVIDLKRPFMSNCPENLISLTHVNIEEKESVGATLTLGPTITCILRSQQNPDCYVVGAVDGFLRICSLYTMQCLQTIKAHLGVVCQVKPIPYSQKMFVTCGTDGYIKLWMWEQKECILSCEIGHEPLVDVCWSPMHATVVLAISSDVLHIWDIRRQTHAPIASHYFQYQLLNVEFSLCGKFITIGTAEGKIIFASLMDMPRPEYFKSEAFYSAISRKLKNTGKMDLANLIIKDNKRNKTF